MKLEEKIGLTCVLDLYLANLKNKQNKKGHRQ
jgi:hypothetical protein